MSASSIVTPHLVLSSIRSSALPTGIYASRLAASAHRAPLYAPRHKKCQRRAGSTTPESQPNVGDRRCMAFYSLIGMELILHKMTSNPHVMKISYRAIDRCQLAAKLDASLCASQPTRHLHSVNSPMKLPKGLPHEGERLNKRRTMLAKDRFRHMK